MPGCAMGEIRGWRGFFDAVERMRELQKIYRRTKSPSSHAAAKKCEAEVDKVIKAKRAEWSRGATPSLSGMNDKADEQTNSGGRKCSR